MRKIFLIILSLFSVAAIAQIDPTVTSQRFVPVDTAAGPQTVMPLVRSLGILRFNKLSGKFQYWAGTVWKNVASGSSGNCYPTIVDLAVNHQLVTTDFSTCSNEGVLRFTGSGTYTITVPTNATAAIASKSRLAVLNQGTHYILVSYAGGVTPHSVSDTIAVGSSAVFYKNGTNDWDLYGGGINSGSGSGGDCAPVNTGYSVDHSLVSTDFANCSGEGVMRFSSTGTYTLTVNTNATAAINVNSGLGIINQSTHNLTVAFAVGVTHNENSLIIPAKTSAYLYKYATDGWDLQGPGTASGSGIGSVVAGTAIGVDNTDAANPIVTNNGVRSVVAGTAIAVNITDPRNPIITNNGVRSVVAGTNVTINNTDPRNPIISATGGGGSGTVTSVALAAGTTGTAPNVTGSPVTTSGTLTFNIPVAGSGVTSGTLTNGTQSIYGAKTHINDALFSTKLGVGISPTARLQLAAGTTAAGTGPFKFTSGPLMTTPEVGTFEYLNPHLYFTTATGSRSQIDNQYQILTAHDGITKTGSDFALGGAQTNDVDIDGGGHDFTIHDGQLILTDQTINATSANGDTYLFDASSGGNVGHVGVAPTLVDLYSENTGDGGRLTMTPSSGKLYYSEGTGNYVDATSAGVTIAATTTNDDITLTSIDDININASDDVQLNGVTGTVNQQIRVNATGGWEFFTSTAGSGTVTGVTGTTNRITSSGGTTPAIDISATFEALLGKVANRIDQNNAATTSAQLATKISDESGTGVVAYTTSPTFVTPILGTPTSVTLTNGTGLPLTGTTGTLAVNRGGTGTTTPALVAGTNVSITGTWPNQTINSTSSGVTNSAVNNEIMRSDGTNATPSGVFVGTGALGSMTLGSGSIAGDRTETISSSTSTSSKHTTLHGSTATWDVNTDAGGSASIITIAPGSAIITVGDINTDGTVKGGNGTSGSNNGRGLNGIGGSAYTGSGNGNGGDFIVAGGSGNGTGKNGSFKIAGSEKIVPTNLTPGSATTSAINSTTAILYVDCTNGNQVVTLPDGTTNQYRIIRIMKVDVSVNTLKVRVTGSDTINGSASDVTYLTQFDGGTYHNMAGGTAWIIQK